MFFAHDQIERDWWNGKKNHKFLYLSDSRLLFFRAPLFLRIHLGLEKENIGKDITKWEVLKYDEAKNVNKIDTTQDSLQIKKNNFISLTRYATTSLFTGIFRVKSVFVSSAATVIKTDADLMYGIIVPLRLSVPAGSRVGMLSTANCMQKNMHRQKESGLGL